MFDLKELQKISKQIKERNKQEERNKALENNQRKRKQVFQDQLHKVLSIKE